MKKTISILTALLLVCTMRAMEEKSEPIAMNAFSVSRRLPDLAPSPASSENSPIPRSPSALSRLIEQAGGSQNLPPQSPRNKYGLRPESLVQNIFWNWAIRLETAHRKKYPKVSQEELRSLSLSDWAELETAFMLKYGEEFDAATRQDVLSNTQQVQGLAVLLGTFLAIKDETLGNKQKELYAGSYASSHSSFLTSSCEKNSLNEETLDNTILPLGSVFDTE